MKTLGIAFALFLITSFTFAQSAKIEAFKKLNTDFSKYKTYQFSSQVDSKLDAGFYFLNDVVLKDLVRNSVNNELQGLGYKKVNQMPDLVVSFRVFDKPATLTGYTSYGTTYWGTEMREPEDKTSFEVKAGTLIVSLVDRKDGQVVWQGFASGLMDGNVFNRKEDKIKEAVNLIFDEYNQRADNITSK